MSSSAFLACWDSEANKKMMIFLLEGLSERKGSQLRL